MIIKCPKCNHFVVDTTVVCPHCGEILKNTVQTPQEERIQPSQQSVEADAKVTPSAPIPPVVPPQEEVEAEPVVSSETVIPENVLIQPEPSSQIIVDPVTSPAPVPASPSPMAQPVQSSPSPMAQPSQQPMQGSAPVAPLPAYQRAKKSNGMIIALIVFLTILLCGVGGYLYYDSVYLPAKIDREAPRYYTMANAVVLRSSKSAGADFNKVASLPYGTELITYEQDAEWSSVKANTTTADGSQPKGFVASQFILSKPDFFLLNSIFGDQDSREVVFTTKCRQALLNYFKEHGFVGKIDDQMRQDAGIATIPDSDNQWQVFCRPKDVKPNNVLFKRLHDKNSKFTDFAVIIQNISNGERRLLYFYFSDDEQPYLWFEQGAPESGYIKDAVITRSGYLQAYYSY